MERENNKNINNKSRSVNSKNTDNSAKRKKSLSPKEELERKKARRRRAKRRARVRVGFIIFITLLIVLIIMPIFTAISLLTSINNNDLVEAVKPISNQPINILVIGTDSGDLTQSNNDAIKRTDTIMVVNYNPNTDKINLVSIPRDTMIEVDAYDGAGTLRHYWKINSAYILGGEEELIEHVEYLLDTTINYIVEIDYIAFRNFIDAIGGVEMYIEQDMYYDDPYQDLSINFTGGETVLLDGQSAEEFFRWRQNNDGTGFANGDLGRIENQQKFIKEVVNKCLTPGVLFNISDILEVVSKDISTNMAGNDILSFVFKAAFNDGISMSTLQGYDATFYGESFIVAEREDNKEIIEILKTGLVLDESTNRADYNILVLNGTRVDGLAGDLKYDLNGIGYSKVEVGNYQRLEESIILSDNKNLKEQLKIDTGIDNFKGSDEEYSGYDAVIIVGEDLKVY